MNGDKKILDVKNTFTKYKTDGRIYQQMDLQRWKLKINI